jgi:DNA-binding NtrC family response regulator
MSLRRQLRVFVVDDDPVIVTTLAAIFRLHDEFDVKPFVGPLEAAEAIRTEPPDVLIAEVMMSSLSGFDLAIQVRGMHPGCKVLLFSGDPNASEMNEAARIKGFDFEILAKPVHPVELLKRIHETSGRPYDRPTPLQVSRETFANQRDL